jgi:signal transduction histidine kinase
MKPPGRWHLLWSAHPLWALGEAWLVGMLILLGLVGLGDSVTPSVMMSGLFFLCGICGMWAVVRARIPRGRRTRQGLVELGTGFLLSLVMAAGLRLPADLLGWGTVWSKADAGNPANATFLLLCTGPGYVLARVGVWLWRAWDRLRRQRMLWALTHAHLMVVVAAAVMGALGVFLMAPYSGGQALTHPEAATWYTLAGERLLYLIFPVVSLIVMMTIAALAILLPPSAIFSYLVARRTTRRLETLAATARALREGDYAARVAVAGEDEVAQLQADFNAMAEKLEQTLQDLAAQRDTVARLLQSRRELVAGVSHELRTPVATVRAIVESALQRQEQAKGEGAVPAPLLPAALRHDLETTESEILRLQHLIDDLFTLSQAEVDKLALACRPVDLAPLMQRMVAAMAPLAWKSGRVEVVALPLLGDLPPAHADPARLEQVLANLLRNAVRHTPPGGIVAVTAAAEPDAVRVEVRDTGEGIQADDLPHIWERFYRGRDSRSDADGSAGLGLALVKELTEAMGGTVGVDSAVGQGSCFTVRLPKVMEQ